MRDLAWLIQPFDTVEFFADVWQKTPCILSRGNKRRRQDLFGSAALERAIEFGQPSRPRCGWLAPHRASKRPKCRSALVGGST